MYVQLLKRVLIVNTAPAGQDTNRVGAELPLPANSLEKTREEFDPCATDLAAFAETDQPSWSPDLGIRSRILKQPDATHN
jgi:hypothetical protein